MLLACSSGAARVSQGTLQAIQESLQPGQVWLFPGRSSGHLCTKTVLRTIDRLPGEAGIQEVSPRQKLPRRKFAPHILRHSHVVNALMAGVPMPMIQKPDGVQEALYNGDLCHRSAGAGEGGV